MTAEFQSFAFETLLWTGALIALVLILRRPVTRHFGPGAAYALWLLPFARLLLPPLVLPAWLAPAPASEPLPVATYQPMAEVGAEPLMVRPLMQATISIDWTAIAFAVWLAGACAFIAVRFARYFAMRRELLAQGVEVGRCGNVRLVETPMAGSPIAFGVIDKVVALPEGFLDHTEPTQRDLALEHELAHHRARDLLANFAIQPLFAIHWFNPLCWVGWRAMRCDQEAACDARVVSDCDRELRGTYAAVIAAFATGANTSARGALAAPMACPVLGDKSIIHRLRSLTMSDISPRRRIAARALMIGALVALPATASISQAEAIAPAAAPNPPAPPSPQAVPNPPAAPDAPLAPGAPEAPEPPETVDLLIEDGDGGKEKRTVRIERRVTTDADGQTRKESRYFIDGREATVEERGELEEHLETVREAHRDAEEALRETLILREQLGEGSDLRKQMETLRVELRDSSRFSKEMQLAIAKGRANLPMIMADCDGDGATVREQTGSNGKRVVVLCEMAVAENARKAGMENARSAIMQARGAIERNRNLSERERTKALRSLDKALRELERER